ncbi:uncharacterized protein LOC129968296 [Argiope bruennichi]|uniref:uncharacterized protein LOC129968296 n=1 Tax=Argiope bruennichi TaxID=94029 RepID=UPI0024942EEA|nr:uncharacterized protein LOC129968296 [Argiope bruennichi]
MGLFETSLSGYSITENTPFIILHTDKTFHKVSPFLIQKLIASTIGEVKDTKKLKSGDLLIEAATKSQISLPKTILAGYARYKVRPYIPTPLRCFNCQRFGHSKNACLGKQTCSRCASFGHSSTECNADPKCINCDKTHTADSKESASLPYSQVVKNTISGCTQTDDKLTRVVCPPLTKLQPLTTNKSQSDNPCTLVIAQNLPSRTSKDLKKKGKSKYEVRTEKTESKISPVCKGTNPSKRTFDPAFGRTGVPQPTGHELSNLSSSQTINSKSADKIDETNSELETMSTDKHSQNTDTEIESDNAIEYNPHETIDETPPAPELSTDFTAVDKTVFRQSPQKCSV